MITQAIKRWLDKLFGWLSWKKSPETVYARVGSPLNNGITQDSASRPTIDGSMPQSGVAPLIAGQGEIRCSTIDDWPERVVQSPTPNPGNEKSEQRPIPAASPPTAKTPPGETAKTAISSQDEASSPALPPTPLSAPTSEQKLEFLHYLVKRGIVNEGFTDGQLPDQYRT